MKGVLYERRNKKEGEVMLHTPWKRVAEFKTKKRAEWYIEKKKPGRKKGNWEYDFRPIEEV